MSNLTVDGTSTWISGTPDTRTVLSDGPTGSLGAAAQINGLSKLAVDLETTLGSAATLKGSTADLATRLSTLLAANGSLQSGNAFPVSPPPVAGQLFYRTDLALVYVYDAILAQWALGFQSDLYALLDGTLPFTGPLTIKSSVPGIRYIGTEVNAKDWTLRESGGTLKTYLNTGTEVTPILTEDNFFCPTGASMAFGSASAPNGWLLCNGTAYSRSTYARLYSVIGVAYGVGDGSTTFNVPDKRGRVSIGVDGSANRITSASTNGANADTLGGAGGAETHTLITNEIPPHPHTINGSDGMSGTGGAFQNVIRYNSTNGTITTSSTGGGGAHSNTQPWLAEYWIIKT